MLNKKVTVSDKYQIVIPKKIREIMKLKKGEKLNLTVAVHNRVPTVTLTPTNFNWAEYLHGLGKGIWKGVDAQEYVNSLRDEWEQRLEELYPPATEK